MYVWIMDFYDKRSHIITLCNCLQFTVKILNVGCLKTILVLLRGIFILLTITPTILIPILSMLLATPLYIGIINYI